ncbi:MAG: Rpn family recombination-promoting nuclease/putative transposase [Alphaproteobacteria bacterium]|nr:Rpn family recombination-promoting nuclease/putative transposase [Alphaproteobacteria bacterium]
MAKDQCTPHLKTREQDHGRMRFLNPKTDYAFKKIFGSDASRDILISFLNAVLDLTGTGTIVDVIILDPYQVPRIKGWKDSCVDVRAQDQKGRSFIVEMQVLVHAGLEKRILYNACKAYVGQIASAEDYSKLVEVIAITITDFVMFRELAGTTGIFRLRASENPNVTHQDMALVFVELPKFTKTEAALETPLDRWLYFLKTAGSLDVVPKALSIDPAIDHALRIANKAALSAEELEDQEKREQWIGIQKGMMLDVDEARRLGEEKGRTEGKAEMLLRQLPMRFGSVPPEIEERVRTATSDQLNEWSVRMMTAHSLADVFGPDTRH